MRSQSVQPGQKRNRRFSCEDSITSKIFGYFSNRCHSISGRDPSAEKQKFLTRMHPIEPSLCDGSNGSIGVENQANSRMLT